MKLPKEYKSLLDEKETERAIVSIKDIFQMALSTSLNLSRVTAPLFVPSGLGLNDDLNGIERPVSFPIKAIDGVKAEIVHSLAKWKRWKVTRLGLNAGFGIYCDMNAIRADEELDCIHSLYVDQWDWCMAIDPMDRSIMYLKEVVGRIYQCLKQVEFYIYDRYEAIKPILPKDITFIHSEDLEKHYPNLTPKEREDEVCRKLGAVFIIGIGAKLHSGKPHDNRAPDYDDWITETGDGHRGLNGDLLVWNPVLQCAFELSSMGIRVSPTSLIAQLKEASCPERAELQFHRQLLEGKLSQTMGGGIGQSRLCMYFLRKAHIGEIQVSIWSRETIDDCASRGIKLL